jgi:thiol-disulfide isomerase/thioredoxin
MKNIVLISALGFCPLFAQQLPDANFLLGHSNEELKKHQTYQVEMETTGSGTESGNPISPRTSLQTTFFRSPDRSRSESDDFTIVADGQYTWTYMASRKAYAKQAAIANPLERMGNTVMEAMRQAWSTARTLREETLEVDGQRMDCWVVELNLGDMMAGMMAATRRDLKIPDDSLPNPPKINQMIAQYWFDKETGLMRQGITTGKVQVGIVSIETKAQILTRYKFDEPLPDSLFQFTPPDGTKEVENMNAVLSPASSQPNLAGKAAPYFAVKSLDDKAYSLSDLKGKVVVLDFGATWCGPCRNEIPAIGKLYKDFKDQGVVVLSVDVGEERGLVEKFLKTAGVSYPVALTANTDIVYDYQRNPSWVTTSNPPYSNNRQTGCNASPPNA